MTFSEILASPLLTGYLLVMAFVLGAVFGSFFNCMAWRIVHGESVLHGRSHCAVCGHPLAAKDLVPIFSYTALHGRCRYCNEKISPRYTIVEAVCACGFMISVIRFGLTVHTVVAVVLFCLLLTLSLVDLDSMIIPDRFIAAAAVLWAVSLPGIFREDFITYQTYGNEALFSLSLFGVRGLLGAYVKGIAGAVALGGGMLLLSLVFDQVTGKESLGGGDVKLFFSAGLFLGPWAGLLCLLLSCLIGLVFALGRKEAKIPFGPSISAALFICLLWGQQIVNAYLGLFM